MEAEETGPIRPIRLVRTSRAALNPQGIVLKPERGPFAGHLALSYLSERLVTFFKGSPGLFLVLQKIEAKPMEWPR